MINDTNRSRFSGVMIVNVLPPFLNHSVQHINQILLKIPDIIFIMTTCDKFYISMQNIMASHSNLTQSRKLKKIDFKH